MSLSKADIIEALLFASDKPVPLKKLAQVAGLEPRAALAEIDVLREEKDRIGALQIVEVAGGWQVVTKPQYSPFIRQLRESPRQRLSRAAFEVLAIVAYRQPATRAEIEELRSVDCAGSLQLLLEKKLITFAGRKEAPGRPWLYATTSQFLDHFGLRNIADLPSLAELAELNDAAEYSNGSGGNGARNLFARGAMKSGVSDGETRSVLDGTNQKAETNETLESQPIENGPRGEDAI
jgi:segregation and condensation protein B